MFLVCSHVGDLGNVRADYNGVVNVILQDNLISLSGPNSVIGRAFVVIWFTHILVGDLEIPGGLGQYSASAIPRYSRAPLIRTRFHSFSFKIIYNKNFVAGVC